MSDQQPEALLLADALAAWEWTSDGLCGKAAAELRRLHGEIESLRAELTLLGSACDKLRMMHREEIKQYFNQTRREWRGLSEEEITDAVREADLDWQQGWTLEESEPNRYTQLARALDAALKERNKGSL
jgi:hypothetical protein